MYCLFAPRRCFSQKVDAWIAPVSWQQEWDRHRAVGTSFVRLQCKWKKTKKKKWKERKKRTPSACVIPPATASNRQSRCCVVSALAPLFNYSQASIYCFHFHKQHNGQIARTLRISFRGAIVQWLLVGALGIFWLESPACYVFNRQGNMRRKEWEWVPQNTLGFVDCDGPYRGVNLSSETHWRLCTLWK